MTYTKTVWVNDSIPAINVSNLGNIETGIYNNDAAITALGIRVNEFGINPKHPDYGAVGNNIANDTTAFLLANADALSEHRPLWYSEGHYKLTDKLNFSSGQIVRGDGQEPNNGTPTRLNFSGIDSATSAIEISGGSNIVLQDFYVTGRTAGSADEISVIGNSRAVVLERITVNTSTTGSGVAFAPLGTGAENVIKSSIRNCTVVGAQYGFRVGGSSTSIGLDQCYANVCTTAGYLMQGTYLTLTSCASDTNGLYGYLIQNAVGVTFTGCGAESNGRTGWHCVNAEQVNLIGCRGVSNNTSADVTLPAFLGINDASDYVTCIGCRDTFPNGASAAAVMNWQGTAPTAVTLINNDFTIKGVQNILRDTVAVRRVALEAGVTAKAPLNIAHGVAPTSPVDGDIWTTTAGLFVRVNGSTVGPLT